MTAKGGGLIPLPGKYWHVPLEKNWGRKKIEQAPYSTLILIF